MKSLKNQLAIAALMVLPALYSLSAAAADLTVWRTAAIGDVVGNGQFVDTDQVFVGNSSSAKICGGATLPCHIAISLKSKTTVSATPMSNVQGVLNVLGPDPVFHLPTNVIASYPLDGALNINLQTASGVATGKVVFGGGAPVNFTANLSVNAMVIFDQQSNPVTGPIPVLRIDLTLQ